MNTVTSRAVTVVLTLFSAAMPMLSQNKTVTVKETTEHAYIKLQLQQTAQIKAKMDKLFAQFEIDSEKCLAIDSDGKPLLQGKEFDACQHRASELIEATAREIPIQFQKVSSESIELLQRQLEAVDKCVSLYRTTIDRKTSDLTVRQTELVNTCQLLDLYPPIKAAGQLK